MIKIRMSFINTYKAIDREFIHPKYFKYIDILVSKNKLELIQN